jgi:hypothetical protein
MNGDRRTNGKLHCSLRPTNLVETHSTLIECSHSEVRSKRRLIALRLDCLAVLPIESLRCGRLALVREANRLGPVASESARKCCATSGPEC